MVFFMTFSDNEKQKMENAMKGKSKQKDIDREGKPGLKVFLVSL